MTVRRWACAALLMAAMAVPACSARPDTGFVANAPGEDGGAVGVGDDDASAASATDAGSAGTTAASSSGDAASGGVDGGPGVVLGDASVSDSELGTPVTLTMDSFTVAANSEVYMCQQFGNPFGKDVDLVKMVGSMSMGSHHFFLFNMTPSTGRNTTAALEPCPDKGLEFHPFPYLSQQPEYTVQYGPGMGYPLVGQNGLMMNVHYLNVSATAVTPKVTIAIYPAKAGTVTTHVGTIFLNSQSIYVPAETPQTNEVAATKSNVPIGDEGYTIFTNWSHMHQYATDFQASTGGALFYEEKQWSEPPLITAGTGMNQSPLLPKTMAAGASITWTCMYYNPTTQPMTFGDSAMTDDMCIYLGQYYPADGTPTSNANYPDVIVSQQ
jgi:hypothetical protein